VSVDQIERARALVDVATVQNRYNLLDRASDDVLRYCTEQGIGFLPWFPIASGRLAEPVWARWRRRPSGSGSPRPPSRWRGCCSGRR
jgi:aryl-alcohol dehydrogenase-like predicted oxidoreductase